LIACVQGCATPLTVISDEQQAGLGKIAIVSFDKEPIVSLGGLNSENEGAFRAYWAAEGALDAFGASVDECGLLFVFCALIFVPAAALEQAASVESADPVSFQEGIQNSSDIMRNGSAILNTKLTEIAVDYSDYKFSGVSIDPKIIAENTLYPNLKKRGYESVLEVSIDKIRSKSPEKKNIIYFVIEGSATLKKTSTGEVILAREFMTGTSANRPADWLVNGGRNLILELNRAYELLAQQIIESIFLTEFILEEQKIQKHVGGALLDNEYQFEPETVYPGTSQCGALFSNLSIVVSENCNEFKNQKIADELQPFFIWKAYPASFIYQQRYGVNDLTERPWLKFNFKSRESMGGSDLAAVDQKLMSASQVRYDLRLFSWPDGLVYEESGLTEAEYQIRQSLESCRSYTWSVRARYINNRKIRASGWSLPRRFRTPCGIDGTGEEEVTIPEISPLKDPVTMVHIKGGHFLMGKANGSADDIYLKQHKVYVADFLLDEHEVTQRQFARVMHFNPSKQWFPENPVEQVRWDQARQYCERVGKRLPSEVEWEFAARADTESRFSFDEKDARDYGNYAASIGKTSPVKSFKPNLWGLYDLHGNVAEWVDDWYGPYLVEPPEHSYWAAESFDKVIRGGSFNSLPEEAASYARNKNTPIEISDEIGFRCAVD
jgi:formylglycine-generating enzyme required for sulfatase activity